jgi:hypothetical protein
VPASATDSHHPRQSLRPQNSSGPRVPPTTSTSPVSLHAHLLVLAQPSEIWFAKIENEVIARGVFTSVPDLARKLRRYINAYSANARPIQRKYSDPTRRVRSNELTATGHQSSKTIVFRLSQFSTTIASSAMSVNADRKALTGLLASRNLISCAGNHNAFATQTAVSK